MKRKRLSPIEKARIDRENRERKRCRDAILKRLRTAPATIDQLDSAAGASKPLVNAVLFDLLHASRVTNRGFTFFYNHRRGL